MAAEHRPDCFISVDIETSGPHPGRFSLLSIGACVASDPARAFYTELQPVSLEADPVAMAVHGLSLEDLTQYGLPPAEAMARFEIWLAEQTPPGGRPTFVAFNAVFDWMFISEYFHRYLGRNPFGHSALDIKALYMGLTGAPWCQTSLRFVAARYGQPEALTHHALSDARDQAALFRNMMEEASAHGFGWL